MQTLGVNAVTVYTGTSLDDLELVECYQWPGVYFWANAGTTYYLQYHGGGMRIDAVSPPVADFRYAPGTPSTSDDVVFSYYNGGYWDPTVTGWDWHFGDGTTASGESVSHRYAANGDYSVTLHRVGTRRAHEHPGLRPACATTRHHATRGDCRR